jgi:hypothetical protein
MTRLTLALMASLLGSASAHGHEDGQQAYDRFCCNGDGMSGDCQPVPASAVSPIPGGYRIELAPGVHRLVTKPHTFTRSQGDTRQSDDGRYHVCLYPSEEHLRCFYAPPFGS